MSNNLAGYFKSSADIDIINSGNSTDISANHFFDLISECKEFNEKERNINQNENFYDIWPLPENKLNLNNESTQFGKDFLFAINDPLADPIRPIVTKYYGEQEAAKRVLPNTHSVSSDVQGLQTLIKSGCIRSAINLSSQILKEIKEGSEMIISPYSLQIWFFRIAALMKLKFFKEAQFELTQFENFNKIQFYYENYPETYSAAEQRKGCMVPFGLRILNAELSIYLGKSDISIANLYKILETTEEIFEKNIKNNKHGDGLKIWSERKAKVLFSIANILTMKKHYEKTFEIFSQILNLEYIDKCAVWSSIGKLFVQTGNLKDANDSFLKAKHFSRPESNEHKSRILINASFIRIANGSYEEAYDVLSEASILVPSNPTLINNMAFCLFYSGNLKDAIGLIEKFIMRENRGNVNENLIFNLCTLYELESAKAHQKKLQLLLWLNLYAGDGFYEACLQL